MGVVRGDQGSRLCRKTTLQRKEILETSYSKLSDQYGHHTVGEILSYLHMAYALNTTTNETVDVCVICLRFLYYIQDPCFTLNNLV